MHKNVGNGSVWHKLLWASVGLWNKLFWFIVTPIIVVGLVFLFYIYRVAL